MSAIEEQPASGAPPGLAVGVDTGGTHTDLVLVEDGRVVTLKVPSTPGDLSLGIVDGLRHLLEEARYPASDIERFVYASTLVTNLIVEEAAASVGLIVTEGFRDVLEIGRASRKPHIYDIHWRPVRPLVPRHLRLTVRERIDHQGRVLVALDEASTRTALAELAAAGVSSIAVCFLHAYANPAHERRIAELAAEICPDVDISLSSEVVREFREFERMSTTAVNAFIKRPIMHHLDGLRTALGDLGVMATPFIMRGNGGISTFEATKRLPVAITHSGPMGGIVGATALAAACGIENIITLDMGGTSADVSLVAGGQPILTNRGHAGPHPLLVPMLDLVTIGAGGGSIASVEGGSALRVGPRSAGSVPGPACYGQGGEAPTVTDANLIAARLNPGYFLGGRRQLDPALAHAALASHVADPLGLGVEEAALGVLAVAEAHMMNAIRLVSVERGLDPREFTLVAFGGAGPLHAVRLAEALSIDRVLIPPAPGNLSAMGLLAADVRHDFVRTLVADAAITPPDQLRMGFDELVAEARAALDHEGIPQSRQRCLLSVDLRYQGQNYELALAVPNDLLAGDSLTPIVQRFHRQHEQVYGYQLPDRAVQIVNLRVTALGITAKISWPADRRTGATASADRRRVVVAPGDARDLPVYRHADARPGREIEGPAIVEYAGSTLFLCPGWRARFDDVLNAHLSRDQAA